MLWVQGLPRIQCDESAEDNNRTPEAWGKAFVWQAWGSRFNPSTIKIKLQPKQQSQTQADICMRVLPSLQRRQTCRGKQTLDASERCNTNHWEAPELKGSFVLDFQHQEGKRKPVKQKGNIIDLLWFWDWAWAADLRLGIFLPQPPKFWGYRQIPLFLTPSTYPNRAGGDIFKREIFKVFSTDI